MTRNVVRLVAKGRDLSAQLEQSLIVAEKHGLDWLHEVAKAQRTKFDGRAYSKAHLVHPDSLPSEYALWVTSDA